MSNKNLRYPSSLTPRQRRLARRTNYAEIRELMMVLGRSWFTRRVTARHRRRKLMELNSAGRAYCRHVGWLAMPENLLR